MPMIAPPYCWATPTAEVMTLMVVAMPSPTPASALRDPAVSSAALICWTASLAASTAGAMALALAWVISSCRPSIAPRRVPL